MDVFLARQPIFDEDENVYAYEVLYRSGVTNEFDGTQGDKASSAVILNTFQTVGIENLANKKPVFINFTETLICDEVATLIPSHLLVVEILEDVKPRKEIVEKCRILKKLGYRIALDDFLDLPGYDVLVELADIIKIDFLATSPEKIEGIMSHFKRPGLEYLAEKVESRKEFEYARGLGFKYFQGYFFSKPEIVSSKKITPVRANCMRLVNLISGREDLDFEKINQVIAQDVSLTYNLLKLVNSAAFGFRHRIEKTKQALVLLGTKEIKKWIYLMILHELGMGKPDELTRLSLIRARFLELISQDSSFKDKSEDLFLLGLFSLLDVMLERPLGEILLEIRASELITAALLEKGGELDSVYQMALHYEKGEWEEVLNNAQKLDMDCRLLARAYTGALRWYQALAG